MDRQIDSGDSSSLQAEVLHVLNATKYDHETVCGWLLGGHCQHTQLDPWTLAVPGGKPAPSHPEPAQVTSICLLLKRMRWRWEIHGRTGGDAIALYRKLYHSLFLIYEVYDYMKFMIVYL